MALNEGLIRPLTKRCYVFPNRQITTIFINFITIQGLPMDRPPGGGGKLRGGSADQLSRFTLDSQGIDHSVKGKNEKF